MGFKRKSIRLTWPEDHSLYGFEVEIRRPNIGQVRQMVEGPPEEMSDDERDQRAAQLMADLIVTWNYEGDDGYPVPVDVDEIMVLDVEMRAEITSKILEAIQPPAPLSQGSSAGARVPVELPPMEPPSPNLTNLPEQSSSSPRWSDLADIRTAP